MRTALKPHIPTECYTVIDRDSLDPVTVETFKMKGQAENARYKLAKRNPELTLGIGEYDCGGFLDDVTDEAEAVGDYRATYGIGAE